MPENIESPLNWPQAGLAGVPESDNGLTPGASGSAESANGDDSAEGARPDGNHGENGENGESKATQTKAPPAGPAKGNRSDLGEGIATIARSIDEFSKTADALRARAGKGDTEVDARLAETEATLQRLKEAAAGVSEKLEQINGVLDHRLEGLNTQLAFAPNTFDIEDPALIAQTDFRGGLPGIVGNGEKAPITAAAAGGVTWPPWAPAVKPSLWSRFTRSAIAIPLLLVAVIVVGAVAYKVVKNKNVVTPGVSVSQGLNTFGSAKVIAGPECHAGTTTATVQLASAQAKNGNYAMSLAGTVSNSASKTLQNTVISWTVTYADGNTATQSAPVNKGAGVPGKSTKTWFAVASHDEGSVPPASVKINSIGAEPVQPACT